MLRPLSELLVLTDALCRVKTCILATNQIRQRLNDNSFRWMHDRSRKLRSCSANDDEWCEKQYHLYLEVGSESELTAQLPWNTFLRLVTTDKFHANAVLILIKTTCTSAEKDTQYYTTHLRPHEEQRQTSNSIPLIDEQLFCEQAFAISHAFEYDLSPDADSELDSLLLQDLRRA